MNKAVATPELLIFPSAAAMADAAAQSIVRHLAAAVATRGQAGVVGAGGRTPAAIYDRLSHVDVPWRQVIIVPGDERWVKPGDAASNEAMIAQALVRDRARDVRLLSLKCEAETPAVGLAEIAQRLQSMPRPFDLVMLGMGTDGHTASLFPGAEGLAAALDPAGAADLAAITPDPLPPEAPYARISLTVRALLDARHIMLLIHGAAKKAVLDAALAGSDVAAMPVRAVLHQDKVPVSVYYAD